jgi:GH18 family chitinase
MMIDAAAHLDRVSRKRHLSGKSKSAQDHQSAAGVFAIEMMERRVLLSVGSSPETIVGYFPDYEYSSKWTSVNLSGLTEVDYFSIVANDDGTLPTTSMSGDSFSQLQKIVTTAHAMTPRVAVSIVVDWHTDYQTIAQSPAATATFVSSLISFCSTYNLDGIDLDYEPGTLTTAQMDAYGNLLAALHNQTAAHALVLSCAVQVSQMIIPQAYIADVDRFNVMDYELDYNSSAPYSQSITYLNDWANYGVPKSKLLMGVAFYGRSGTSWANTTALTYGSIISEYAAANGGAYPAADLDSVTINGTTWGYNGITTLQEKAQYVQQNGYGGMMIWELGQDSFANDKYDSYSLFPAIKSAFGTAPLVSVNTDILTINTASAGGATSLSESGGSFNVSGPVGTYSVASSTVDSIFVTDTGGADTLNINTSLNEPVTFVGGGSGRDTVNVTAGTVDLESAPSGYGLMNEALGTLSIGSGAEIVLANAASHTNHTVLFLSGLSIAGASGKWTGQLDLGWNDLVVHNGNLATISNQLTSGFNAAGGSNWNGDGIISSAAGSNTSHLTTLGVSSGLTSFDTNSVLTTDVLIKYTYYGDANLDGQVDGSDYTLIDNGFHNHLTGWSNGDFNYDGRIDGSDYTLIDNACNTQSASLATQIAPAARLAKSAAALVTPIFSRMQITRLDSTGADGFSNWKMKRNSIAREIFQPAESVLEE